MKKHGKLKAVKRRLMSGAVAAVLGPALALGSVAMGGAQTAQAAVNRADCKVYAVAVTRNGNGKIPKNLKFIEEQLKDDQFAAYKGFRLVETKRLKLKIGAEGSAPMKSGHKVRLSLLGGDAKRLRLHAKLSARSGSKDLVNTEYEIDNRGVLIIGGVKHKVGEVAGKLFFAIQCAGA